MDYNITLTFTDKSSHRAKMLLLVIGQACNKLGIFVETNDVAIVVFEDGERVLDTVEPINLDRP